MKKISIVRLKPKTFDLRYLINLGMKITFDQHQTNLNSANYFSVNHVTFTGSF